MEILTRFNINDEVWFFHSTSQKAVQGRIKEINVLIGGQPKYRRSNDGKRSLIRTGEYEEQRFVHRYYIDDMVTKNGVCKSAYDIYETKEKLIEGIILNANK